MSPRPKDDKADKSIKEHRPEKEVTKTCPVNVGYKNFNESVEMFDYFFNLLHHWPPNLNVNKEAREGFDKAHAIYRKVSSVVSMLKGPLECKKLSNRINQEAGREVGNASEVAHSMIYIFTMNEIRDAHFDGDWSVGASVI